MALTTAQAQTLNAAILAAPDLSAIPNTVDGAYEVARLLNLPSSPVVNAWATNAPVAAVLDAVNWAQYTPSDTIDGTAAYTNRLLAIQTKQMNLQNMLVGRDTLDASKANVRAGLRDAVTGVPAGAAGGNVNPGGANGITVLNALLRNTTRGEAILAAGEATTGAVTAKLLGYEGALSYQDIEAARSA